MALLSAMFDAEKSIQPCFARQLVKDVFILFTGYASLSEPLQFLYAMVALLAERRLDVVIPAPKRQVDRNMYYPFRSELPVRRLDISNAIQGFKDDSTTRIVLNEGLGLELSNFGRLLKKRPMVSDEHRWRNSWQTNNLWFRQTKYSGRRNIEADEIFAEVQWKVMREDMRTWSH